MEKHAKPYNLTINGNVNALHTPDTDCAGVDEWFDATDDEDREIAAGIRHFNMANGEAGQ